MTYLVVKQEDIKVSCCDQCPHLGREMGGVLYCAAKGAPDSGYIVLGAEVRIKISDKCPLLSK